MSVDSLNRVKYAGLDFDTALDEIQTRLQVKFASVYNDFAIASLGMMLLDVFAFGMDTLSFYLDRRATDTFLTTARTRKSVARAARQLGYKMSPAVAASVDVTINPTTAQIFSVTIPIGFQLKSPDGSIWESTETYTWPASNNTPQTLTFSQTTTLQLIFTSDGTSNQVFKINGIPSDEFIVGAGSDGVAQTRLTVNGVDWTESDLLTFGATNQYEIGYNDDPPTLRLGDGIAGNIPASGSQLRFTYKSSRGPAGAVTAGNLTTPVTPLVVNFTSIPLTITNATGSSGGTPPESIEKAKANAPLYFKSRGINVTKEDYEVRAGSFTDSVFGAIAVAKAIATRGADSDGYLQTLLDEIKATGDSYVTTVSSSVTSVNGTLADAQTNITTAQTSASNVSTDLSAISTQVTTALTQSQDANGASGTMSSVLSQLISATTDALSAVDAIGTGASDQLTTATQNKIVGDIGLVQSLVSTLNTNSSTITTDLGSIITALNSIKTTVTSATTDIGTVSSSLTTATSDVTSAKNALTALSAAVVAISNNVDSLADQILDHVGAFLSSDCQTNLVEVPVLTLDSDGFYVAPSIALVQSLQDQLDSKKEVTQVVKAFAATNLLVAADIAVNVGVLPGYVESTVRSLVQAKILNVLKGRAFGSNLKLSEFYWQLNPNGVPLAGVDHVTVRITAPSDKLDGDGNLVVADNEVVTRGTITITSEIVTE